MHYCQNNACACARVCAYIATLAHYATGDWGFCFVGWRQDQVGARTELPPTDPDPHQEQERVPDWGDSAAVPSVKSAAFISVLVRLLAVSMLAPLIHCAAAAALSCSGILGANGPITSRTFIHSHPQFH